MHHHCSTWHGGRIREVIIWRGITEMGCKCLSFLPQSELIYSVCSQGWGHFAFWKKARPAATSKHFGGDGSQSVSSPHQCGAASGQELWAGKNTPWKMPWESKRGNLAKSSLEMFVIALAVSHLLLEDKLCIWWERKSERRRGQRGREKRQSVWFSYRVWHFSSNILIWNIQNRFFLGV